MKLYRGLTFCPKCCLDKDVQGNGRTISQLRGAYYTISKEYASEYGIVHVVDVPIKALGKVLKLQYFFQLEQWIDEQVTSGKCPSKEPNDVTTHMLSLGYNAVVIKGGMEVILIQPDLIQRVEKGLRRVSDIRKGVSSLQKVEGRN